jgi:hypothetical protein
MSRVCSLVESNAQVLPSGEVGDVQTGSYFALLI